MSIFPLPVFEADGDAHHRSELSLEQQHAQLAPPDSVVVRVGAMKMVAEYPCSLDTRPGCGSKLIARTHRGTEVVEMLTTTCGNAGCSKSVDRDDMRAFIDESGGREYPFHSDGRVLRMATVEDLNKQSLLESSKLDQLRICRGHIDDAGLNMKLIDVEPILGGELLTFYYMAEDRVDFRELVRGLASEFKTRIEMRQVGARDEARLVADYERCGQYCCCKSFLKVLRPISMRSAKLQKATLDPLKISGRCGRLMCCLRYEDETYKELKANLPYKKTRVGTMVGPGIVIDSKVLVQLVLVRLDDDGREIAVPVEELMDPDKCPTAAAAKEEEAARIEAEAASAVPSASVTEQAPEKKKRRRRRKKKTDAKGGGGGGSRPVGGKKTGGGGQSGGRPKRQAGEGGASGAEGGGRKRKRRRRGGRSRGSGGERSGGGESNKSGGGGDS